MICISCIRISFDSFTFSNLEHEVTIQRRLLSIILTTFLPTLIVNIVGHMSNYFKEFFFEGLISTNVTVLLVITTLFISVSESLPTTAYIKMIDVWLIFNLLKPFIDIIVQTYIESLREAEQDKVFRIQLKFYHNLKKV